MPPTLDDLLAFFALALIALAAAALDWPALDLEFAALLPWVR